MDQPISARPSFSDSSNLTNTPIPLFDAHIGCLNESYIQFFQERKRIEEIYIDSLLRLHRRARQIDASIDDRGDLNTTRHAWNEVRENVEREAQARQAFCASLATDVISPLMAYKETQERTRKRIKEDLNEAALAYNEYAETMLPKLKAKYNKKFSEVEEQKKAAATVPPTSPLSSPSTVESYQQVIALKLSPSAPGRSTATGPPLRPLDRRPSGSLSGSRNRSPSGSTPFHDLAHQGKKQLNQLIGFLDKGGAGKETLGGPRENQAFKTARAKRDAEEADKDYRKGVHWLETLRLRRAKLLEAGFNSLESFVNDSASLVKLVLERYTDNMAATTTTQTQLSSHARGIVEKISPEKDVAKIKSLTPRSLASAIPEPILYQHGQVGFCNDLIFGFSLVDYATTKGLKDGMVPKIVRICIQEIDMRGLETEGIYRVSGRHAIVQALQHDIEKDESSFEFDRQKDDIYAVASLLKLYLRELPEPVFRIPPHDRIQLSEDIHEHKTNNFILLRSKMRRLSPVHLVVLKVVVEHLARVAASSDKNKMDAKNLAIVFGGVIFGEDELPKGADLLNVHSEKDTLMEDLIANASVLFNDISAYQSPPLPPTPAGEPATHYSYGSKTTKVATVPPLSSSLPNLPYLGTSVSQSNEDFTPQLPSRPVNSIHPSSRIYPASPGKNKHSTLPDLPQKHEQTNAEREPFRVTPPHVSVPLSTLGPPADSMDGSPTSSPDDLY